MAVLYEGGELECPKCGHLHGPDDELEIRVAYGVPACLSCACQGFVPHRNAQHKVAARFPDELGRQFVPVPVELLDHGGELGLDHIDRMIVIALERHRFEAGEVVWPSIERIAKLAGSSQATVKRHLKALADLGLIGRGRERGRAGRWASTTYDLEPLWQAIADVATAKKGHQGSA